MAVSKEPFCLKAGVQLTTDRGGYTYRNIDSGFSELGEDARYPLVPKNFKVDQPPSMFHPTLHQYFTPSPNK